MGAGANEDIWVLAELDSGRLTTCSGMLLQQAAAQVARHGEAQVHALAFLREGEGAHLPDELGQAGAGRITLFIEPGRQLIEARVPLLSNLLNAERPALFLFPATFGPSELSARLACANNIPLVPDCIDISKPGESRYLFGVSCGGGMAEMDVEMGNDTTIIVTMLCREMDDAVELPRAGAPGVETVTVQCSADGNPLELVDESPIAREDMTLEEAQVIVSGGRGLGGPQGFEPLFELARLIGGHVGASRVATDLSWIDKEHLVGMSGSTVRPAIYLACGISGDPHHLMGMRESGTIIAINKDSEAPIFQIADHAILGEAEPIIQGLITRLEERRAGNR